MDGEWLSNPTDANSAIGPPDYSCNLASRKSLPPPGIRLTLARDPSEALCHFRSVASNTAIDPGPTTVVVTSLV